MIEKTKVTEEVAEPKKLKEQTQFELDADMFEPTPGACGTLVKTKRDIQHLMRLKDIKTTSLKEGEAAVVLYDFTHKETDERAVVLLMADEQRHMYMTQEFDEDFEVMRAGTQQMKLGYDPEGEDADKV